MSSTHTDRDGVMNLVSQHGLRPRYWIAALCGLLLTAACSSQNPTVQSATSQPSTTVPEAVTTVPATTTSVPDSVTSAPTTPPTSEPTTTSSLPNIALAATWSDYEFGPGHDRVLWGLSVGGNQATREEIYDLYEEQSGLSLIHI